MTTEAEAYQVLGVTPHADPEEVRLAYRRLALRHHPDVCPDDPAAARRFQELSDAYRAAMNACRRRGRLAVAATAMTPEEHARQGWQRPSIGRIVREGGRDLSWLERLGGQRMSLATVNENRVFVAFWAAAVVLGVVTAFVAGRLYFYDMAPADIGVVDLALYVAVTMASYAAVLVAAVLLLRLTRRVVWWVNQLRLGWTRALPAGKRPGERDLP